MLLLKRLCYLSNFWDFSLNFFQLDLHSSSTHGKGLRFSWKFVLFSFIFWHHMPCHP